MQNTNDAEFEVNETLHEELKQFLDSIKPGLLSQNLRRMFIDYLEHELETGVPVYFDEFLFPFNCLLDFLDKAEDEREDKMSKPEAEGNYNDESAILLSNQQRIIQFIVTTITPEKIFLINHFNNHDGKESFDFIIVIPDSSQTAFKEYEQIISIVSIHDCSVHFSLHQSIHLNKQISEGHIFYSFVCIKQNLVYGNSQVALTELSPEDINQLLEKANNYFYTGFKRAEAFLDGANNYYGSHEIEMAAFMIQQSIELTLRSIVLALAGNEIKTHCIRVLQKHCLRCAPQLNGVFHGNNEDEERLINLLDRAYLNARYTDKFKIEDKDLILLLERAQILQTKAEQLFEEKINILKTQSKR